jgi:hypothetical protein
MDVRNAFHLLHVFLNNTSIFVIKEIYFQFITLCFPLTYYCWFQHPLTTHKQKPFDTKPSRQMIDCVVLVSLVTWRSYQGHPAMEWLMLSTPSRSKKLSNPLPKSGPAVPSPDCSSPNPYAQCFTVVFYMLGTRTIQIDHRKRKAIP